jgi:transcription elongation GreA/GreB family factor
VFGHLTHTLGEQEIARAFMDLQRVLDRIRRGELEATDDARARITDALDTLRDLRPAA